MVGGNGPAHLRHQLRQASRLEGSIAMEALESARGTLAAAAAALLPKVLDRSCEAHLLLLHATGPCACLLGVGRLEGGGMKGEFLHPSLTATNDVPPQPCIKKTQPIEGRDTHSLRGGVERSIGHVVEGTLEEEETSRLTLQCPSIRHHHHHQAALQLLTAKGLRCVGTDQDHHHCSPSSSKYLLHSLARHRSLAFPLHRNRG